MKYVTLELCTEAVSWALVSLSRLGFQPLFKMKQVELENPETGRKTVFIRGKYSGDDPNDLKALPSVVAVHSGFGIGELLRRSLL